MTIVRVRLVRKPLCRRRGAEQLLDVGLAALTLFLLAILWR
jgi:hypothetical protein